MEQYLNPQSILWKKSGADYILQFLCHNILRYVMAIVVCGVVDVLKVRDGNAQKKTKRFMKSIEMSVGNIYGNITLACIIYNKR
jgi:hypothetical protein